MRTEIANSTSLVILGRLNGRTTQHSSPANLVFGISELISCIGSFITLEACDVTATGTTPGAGLGREPSVYLQAEDTVEIEIRKIGVLYGTLLNLGAKI